MSKTDTLITIAKTLATEWPRFHERLGPGEGDHSTKDYMRELSRRATETFGKDFAEKCISGENGLRVDFHFPDERTVIEIAMSLRNSNSEFERDILKALIAGDRSVGRLVFLTKPGGKARANSPSARAIIKWAESAHNLLIEVIEFGGEAESILEDSE